MLKIIELGTKKSLNNDYIYNQEIRYLEAL